ncbi:hypothetical protein GOP47_0021300 [Adiantum capillus-veneris]|uniref:Pentatricopeptide repeat-containing protein n=1 Tax=Adiantum capillus-veneris TaxID=13818 RepID=A0A9D4Z8C8_ADICA|nr:hypothetical protein GOP47_0021300 [Adiantum capillus-veneris]
METDVIVGSALVDMYAKCGMLEKAKEAFDKIPTRDTSSWNALIIGYVDHGLGYQVVHCFGQMQDEDIAPAVVNFVCILKAYDRIQAIETSEGIHMEVQRQGLLDKHMVQATALVDIYAKCGMLAKAQEVFDALPTRM